MDGPSKALTVCGDRCHTTVLDEIGIARRLQASLIVTRRSEGKVHHEHAAGLGSVPRLPSPADRIAFWTKLHQRRDTLANLIDAAQRGAILTAIHARIPMPTLDYQQAVRLEQAREDARQWDRLADLGTSLVEGHKRLLQTTQQAILDYVDLLRTEIARRQTRAERSAKRDVHRLLYGG